MIRALLAAAVLATSVGAFAQEGGAMGKDTSAPTASAPDTTGSAMAPAKKKTRAECKKELGKNAKDKSAMKECMSGK